MPKIAKIEAKYVETSSHRRFSSSEISDDASILGEPCDENVVVRKCNELIKPSNFNKMEEYERKPVTTDVLFAL